MNIAHICYNIPEKMLSISELAEENEIPCLEAQVFEKIMGLNFVPRDICSTHFDQISRIMHCFFNKYSINKHFIRYFIYAHTADDISPANCSILEKISERFDLNNSLFFGVSLHKCASVFQLFILSKQLFVGLNDNDAILLVISDLAFTGILQYIPGSTVMGDGSALILLKKTDHFHCVIDTYIKEEGSYSKGIFACKENQLKFQSSYNDLVVDSIIAVLSKNKVSISELCYIFPHNVNLFSWKEIAKRLEIPLEKIYLKNVKRIGHCFGSDPFINLLDCIQENKILPGHYYILATVGLGATFASMLVKF